LASILFWEADMIFHDVPPDLTQPCHITLPQPQWWVQNHVQSFKLYIENNKEKQAKCIQMEQNEITLRQHERWIQILIRTKVTKRNWRNLLSKKTYIYIGKIISTLACSYSHMYISLCMTYLTQRRICMWSMWSY